MCTVYMITPTNPLVLSGCDSLKFAPYNSYFPQIENYAFSCGISPQLNLWDKPIVVSQNQINLSNFHNHWSPLPIEDFSYFTVPIEPVKPGYVNRFISEVKPCINGSYKYILILFFF